MILAAAPLAASAQPSASGDWDSPIGRLRIEQQGDAVTGTLLAPRGPCAFRAGDEVLRGTMVDDSLAGRFRVCLAGKGCAAEEWGSALLVVGPDKLAGAVHLRARRCRAPLGRSGGVALERARGPAEAAPAARRTSTPALKAKARAILRDGAAWLHEGNFEKARERFLEAIEVAPDVPEAYNGVGVTYKSRNQHEEALHWYKKSLAVDPDFGDAYYNMACVYALAGERTLALRYLQIAAMNGYATAEGIDEDSDLASLRGSREYRALRDRM